MHDQRRVAQRTQDRPRVRGKMGNEQIDLLPRKLLVDRLPHRVPAASHRRVAAPHRAGRAARLGGDAVGPDEQTAATDAGGRQPLDQFGVVAVEAPTAFAEPSLADLDGVDSTALQRAGALELSVDVVGAAVGAVSMLSSSRN